MKKPAVFVLDSDVFIAAKNTYYAFDICPGGRRVTRTSKPTATFVLAAAAEYLTFVAAGGAGGAEAASADGNVWLTQKLMAKLCDADVRITNYRLKEIVSDGELQKESVIRDLRITPAAVRSTEETV